MSQEERDWFDGPDGYRVVMDGRWDLSDLATMSREFEQCYSFIYCFDSEVTPLSSERIEIALRGYPWRGGYSYVNIYIVLGNQVRWSDKPRLSGLKYASPGWIDLALLADVAIQVAKAIAALSAAGAVAAKSYASASKSLSELRRYRERMKLADLKLTAQQDAELMEFCNAHARYLGFNNVAELTMLTGSSEVTLRLLLAHHRRLRGLAHLIEEEKARFPVEAGKNERN